MAEELLHKDLTEQIIQAFYRVYNKLGYGFLEKVYENALARNVDLPVAGLIKDLKSRGLFEQTLLVFTTEFGRSPSSEGDYGRGHFNAVFSSWLAGGGVKGGMQYGKSDDYGFKVAENECHVHDFHATILHLLGFDHTRLTFRHGGRDYRLTDVNGRVVKEILA